MRGNETGRRRRRHALLRSLLASIALVACAREGPSSAATRLVVGIEARPQDLDPRFASDAHSSRIGDLVFRGLTRRDGRGGRVPDLAESWTFPDERTLVFRLGAEGRFEDGARVLASDVVATYASVLRPETASPKASGLAAVEGIEAPDARTVVFRLRERFAPILEATSLGILPAHAIRGREADLVASGPYRIAERDAEGGVLLESTGDATPIREIAFRVVPDDTVRALELERGRLDLVENAIEPQNLARLERLERICVRRIPGTTFHYLGLNLRKPPLDDARVRRAIALSIDRRRIVATLLAGTARPASGLFSPEHWTFAADVAVPGYDPEQAKRLLDEAGLGDPDGRGPRPRFALEYKTTPLESRRRMAEAIQSFLVAVGIEVSIRSYEWGTFYADVRRGAFEIYSLAWIGIDEPDVSHHLFDSAMTPPRGANRGGYASAEMDALVRRGRETLDADERGRIYGDVQRLAARDLPLVPLWWSDTVVVHHRRLRGFEPAPDGELRSLASARLDADGSARCP